MSDNERMEEIREKIEELNYELSELERKTYNYYIGVASIGNYNYWDEYFVDLGLISEEMARKWAENQVKDSDAFEATYFAIDVETRNKYFRWYCFHQALASMPYNSLNETEKLVKKYLEALNNNIISELKIEHPSFQHINHFQDWK